MPRGLGADKFRWTGAVGGQDCDDNNEEEEAAIKDSNGNDAKGSNRAAVVTFLCHSVVTTEHDTATKRNVHSADPSAPTANN